MLDMAVQLLEDMLDMAVDMGDGDDETNDGQCCDCTTRGTPGCFEDLKIDDSLTVVALCADFPMQLNGPECIGFSAVGDLPPNADKRMFAVKHKKETFFLAHKTMTVLLRQSLRHIVCLRHMQVCYDR
eukprot:GHVR01191294.1.p1 GENE.GHVR01191294.1~~GHVR01191294.1.p1  ORF type:complete len:128 (-),score=20.30 GHVR01191294.1:242-625(-)